jgi:GxxExxY protein
MEFKKAKIPCEREKKLPVYYDGTPLKKYFRADFVCFKSIIIELKATKYSGDADVRQTLNNVKATNYKLGLLINFGTPSLTYKRIVN